MHSVRNPDRHFSHPIWIFLDHPLLRMSKRRLIFCLPSGSYCSVVRRLRLSCRHCVPSRKPGLCADASKVTASGTLLSGIGCASGLYRLAQACGDIEEIFSIRLLKTASVFCRRQQILSLLGVGKHGDVGSFIGSSHGRHLSGLLDRCLFDGVGQSGTVRWRHDIVS